MVARIVISTQLLQAYELTRYRVGLEDAPFTLRIGEYSAALAELHRSAGVSSSAFVTACNPFGRHVDGAANAIAMARLHAWLERRGLRWIAGQGEGDDGAWSAEPSVLALGLSPDGAHALCVEFEQNAVVVIASDAVPRLLLHPRAVVARRDE